jgi:adenylate cyclase
VAPIPASQEWRAAAHKRAGRVLVAVRPFDNLSGDPQQEYFSDGMTVELINHLGMLSPRKLGVIARTSVMKYRHTDRTIAEMGTELSVDYIVEGTVRRDRERVKISARLVQVSDQTNLWAGSYERSLTDVFAVQTEVAAGIAESLAVELLPGRSSFGPDPGSKAYEHYLEGRYFWSEGTEDGFKKGIDCFNRAVKEEPAYGQAYAGLAGCYCMLGWNSMVSPAESLPQAKAAAIEAIMLNDRLAWAHGCLALCKSFGDWDWKEAERGFKHAIELNPSYSDLRSWYALELSALGRGAEAASEVQRALRLDPLSLSLGARAGLILTFAGQHDQAIQQCLKTLDLDPRGFYQTHFVLGIAYEAKGMLDDAVRSMHAAVELSNRAPRALALLGHALAISGEVDQAEALMVELQTRSRERYVSPYDFAAVYAGLGKKDETFECLEKAYQDRSVWLVFLNVVPIFHALRSDARFASLVRRMGFPSAATGGDFSSPYLCHEG